MIHTKFCVSTTSETLKYAILQKLTYCSYPYYLCDLLTKHKNKLNDKAGK